MAKALNIAVIGCGFMGKAHSNAYAQVARFFDCRRVPVRKVVCARSRERVEAFARQWEYESFETDWRRVIGRDDVDAVDICVPNQVHSEIAVAAANAGKMVLCEKPLAMNAREGEMMCQAVEQARVPNLVWYNYRRVPAVTLAKQLIASGKLGRIFHYRACFLQDWTINPDVPQGGAGTWRLDLHSAGSGVTGDLLAHCIDTALWLNGAITRVTAATETFVKQRRHVESGSLTDVGIDDACAVLCHFGNGSLGVFEATRYARGHKALYTFEINGEHASLAWDLHDLHRLKYFDYSDESIVRGWRDVHVTDSDQPYMKAWWVPGLQIGYEHTFIHQLADFLDCLDKNEPFHPNFRDALETQRVCDAIGESSRNGQWCNV